MDASALRRSASSMASNFACSESVSGDARASRGGSSFGDGEADAMRVRS